MRLPFPAAPIAYCRKAVTGPWVWSHLCLRFVRSSLGLPAHAATAAQAWRDIPKTHKHGGTPPKGYPYFFGNVGPAGHVVESDGGGYCYSNDIRVKGKISRVRISEIVSKWGATPLGWSTQLNGVNLPEYHPPVPPKPVHVVPPFHGPYHPGTSGPAIHEVQLRLRITVTSVYDQATVTAVAAYKERHPYLKAEGPAQDIGPQTYASVTKLPLP